VKGAKRAARAAAKKEAKREARWQGRIPDSVLAASCIRPGRQSAMPFAVPKPYPGVLPKDASGAGMAMDSNADIIAAGAWAGGYYGYAFSEGLEFLGYPYLAELSQRPEYRRIVEVIATEMTRKWIKLKSKGDADKTDRIAELNDALDGFAVRDSFKTIAVQDGFFGRSHLYVDTGATDNPEELLTPIGTGRDSLSRTKVAKGSLKALRPVEAVWTYPTNYNSNDPLKGDWYKPDTWFVMGKRIHASRLLTFIGREVPDLLKPAYSFGGLSLTQMAKPYVDNWLQTRQSVNDIVSAFSTFVLKTNMSESLQVGGDAGVRRAEVFNNFRNNRGLFMLDKEQEEFENVSAPLSGLDHLQAQAQEHMACPAGIPLVKFLGITPSGLNASSDGEIRTFYDWIAAYQHALFRENLTRVIDFVQLTIWGEVDDEITYEFEPLWELNEKERAEVEKTGADTAQVRIDSGVISPEEERRRLAGDPSSPYDGLDPDDAPDLLDEEAQGLEPEGGRPDPVAEKQAGALPGQDEARFEEGKHPRDHGKFASSGGRSEGGAAAKVTAKQAQQKASAWLSRDKASAALAQVAGAVKTKIKDPEFIKAAIGTALNQAIGHYVYTHDYVDSDIIAHGIQHIEVGLAVSAAQARGIMRNAVDALIGAYRKPAKDAAEADVPEDDDEFLEALEALREQIGDDGGSLDQ